MHALTIDFWNTLVVAHHNGEARHARRVDAVRTVAAHYRKRPSDEEATRAIRAATTHFDQAWRNEHRTPSADALVQCVWRDLDVTPTDAEHTATVCAFAEGLLECPPALAESVAETLEQLAARFHLALISDTMFAPGNTIRAFLKREGLGAHFRAFVFSDETGFSKPDPRAFRLALETVGATPAQAAHIGDLRRTDVAGAQACGLRAIQYTGVHTDEDGPEPDVSLAYWRDLPGLL